jgi:hypothetical protein
MTEKQTLYPQILAKIITFSLSVVIDRKKLQNCDTGGFELAFKQNPVTVLPYIGIHLTVEGQGIRKPIKVTKNQEEEESTYMYLQNQFLPK